MNLFEIVVQRILENAENERVRRSMSERLFLLGIEIGKGKPLDSLEKLRYANTLPTARYAIAVEEKLADDNPARPTVEQTIDQAIADWLQKEPEFKATLEQWSGEPIEDIEGVVPPEEYEDLKAQLKRLAVQSGKNFTDSELDQLLQKLLYPLDRP